MFEVGDYVVHGNSGVCRVEAVSTMEDTAKTGKTRIYYTLIPLYMTGSKLFVPTDSKKVVTRSVITKKEADKLLADWDKIELLWVDNDKNREAVYKEALRSCDIRQWVRLIKTSYQRNQSRIQNGKKATTNDERYLQLAEENLFGELAIPLKMTRGEVEDYFIAAVREKRPD